MRTTKLPMKNALPVALCFKPHVMPAWVGMSVGAVRCQSGRVASHVRGMWVALRGSGLQIWALAMRHNNIIPAP
jgi:hypothetical protein